MYKNKLMQAWEQIWKIKLLVHNLLRPRKSQTIWSCFHSTTVSAVLLTKLSAVAPSGSYTFLLLFGQIANFLLWMILCFREIKERY